MKTSIDPSVIERFPHVKVGILVGKGVDNSKPNEEITQLMRATEEEISNTLPIKKLIETPKIVDWREAYRSFGFKPSLSIAVL